MEPITCWIFEKLEHEQMGLADWYTGSCAKAEKGDSPVYVHEKIIDFENLQKIQLLF